jgi:hypothetical protein
MQHGSNPPPERLERACDGLSLGEIWNRSANSALTARQIRLEGEAMRTTELRLLDEEDLARRLTDMQIWLDEHRYEASTFTYFFLDRGMMIRVSFKIDVEADAFAQEFGGSLLDTPWAADQLITV